MKDSLQHNWHLPQRQSWAGLMIILYKSAVTIIKSVWPLLVILLFREANKSFSATHLLIVIIASLILINSLIDFFYFRFYIADHELIIRKGFIRKKILAIPLSNVQAVHIEQSWMHQLLNVAKVKIDTAGSEKTEATIDAITISKAEILKAFLLQKENTPSEETMVPQTLETPIIRLSFSDILKLGITANHIQTFFIILAFCLSMYQNLEDIFGRIIFEIIQESSSTISITANAILISGLLILIISILVSLVRIALVYFDFHLAEANQGFKIKSGLTSIRQNLVPFSKIQYISWSANWIRRIIGLFTLELHQASNEDARRRQKVTIPIMHRQHIENLLMHYHSDLLLTAHSIHHIHSTYPFRRMLLAGLLPGILLTLISSSFFNSFALLFLLLIPYVFINSWVFKRNFKLLLSPGAMQIYSGIWGRENTILQWYKVQKITLQQSPYQRRNHIANMKIFTAGGVIRIPYISLELAQLLQNYAMYKIESSDKSWM